MKRMQSVAYIRRSAHSRSDPGDLSREFQIDKVRALAGADAPNLRVIDADWGRSASTDKTAKRLAFLEMLESIERGDVSTVYAYAADRLARSVEWSARLLNACRRAGVTIVTSEGRFEPGNTSTDKLFYFQAITNEDYSKQAEAKRQATVERIHARGDKMGPPFYGAKPGEDVAAVVAAFDATGSAHRAAVLLNAPKGQPVYGERGALIGTGYGLPTRRGGPWTHGSVRQVLVREGKAARLGVRGAKPVAPFAFYRLLRCPCGRTLTGVRNRRLRGRERVTPLTLYRCVGASSDPSHATKSIAESKILEWARDEAARLRLPADEAELSERNEAERARLAAKRERVVELYADGDITRDEKARRIAQIDADLARLTATDVVVDLPAVSWDAPPEKLNAVLRALWERIDLGPDLRPVSAEWRVPEWRS